ncbi:MAG: ComEC/Rec2 family competence protein [Anaerolineae bacterium]
MPRPLLVTTAWLGGLALVVWLDPPWIAPALVAVLAALAWVILARRRRDSDGRRTSHPLFACALALTAALGALRLTAADWRPAAAPWQALDGREVTLRGVVDDAPNVQGIWTVFPLAVESATLDDAPIIAGGLWQAGGAANNLQGALCAIAPARFCAGRVWVRVPTTRALAYGERVALTGKIGQVRDSESFSYREFLARRGVLASIETAHVSAAGGAGGLWLRRTALAVQGRVEAAIDGILRPPESDLLAGVLLGLSRKLPDDVMEALRRSSLSHIVVISGYNITILVGFIAALFLAIRRTTSHIADDDTAWANRLERGVRAISGSRAVLWTTLALLAFYTLLVGASPSAVRAAIMGAFVVWAAAEGRPSSVLIALALSALVITALSPWAVVDVGFQLSFSGALGMIVLATPLTVGIVHLARLDRRRGRVAGAARGTLAVVAATLAATIMTAPLLALYFGQVSLVGLLANALVLPAQPALMLLGGIATAAGMLWLPLGRLLAVAAWLPLEWTLAIPEWLAARPWAAIDNVPLAVPQVAAFYVLVAAWIAWLAYPHPTSRALAFAMPVRSGHAPPNAEDELRPVVTQPIQKLGPPPGDPAADPSRQRLSRRFLAGGALAVVALAAAAWWAGPGQLDGRLRLTVLPTGSAVVARTPAGYRLVIGGGSDAAETEAAVGQAAAPWNAAVAVVAASRADTPHLKPLATVLRRFEVAQAMAPALPHSAAGADWEAALAAHGRGVLEAQPGARVRLPDAVTLEVVGSDADDGAAVYRLTYGDVQFLLAGGLRHPAALAPAAASVLLVSGRADDTLAADLQRAAHPALSIVHGDGGLRPTLEGRVIRLGEGQRPVTLTTDGKDLWVDPAP